MYCTSCRVETLKILHSRLVEHKGLAYCVVVELFDTVFKYIAHVYLKRLSYMHSIQFLDNLTIPVI